MTTPFTQLKQPLQLDYGLLLSTLGLISVGVLLLVSASNRQELVAPLTSTPPGRQGLYALIGLAAMLIIARIDYRFLGTFAIPLYLGVIFLLAIVPFVGESINEVRRWINLGLFPLQPSELAKPIVAVALAKYFAGHRAQMSQMRTPLLSIGIIVMPVGLVFLQPDLGTTIIFMSIWFGMVIMAGIRFSHLAEFMIAAIIGVWVFSRFAFRSYMHDRIAVFLDPTQDPLGAGYNILQSEISVGSGGLLGKGLFNCTQSQLNFLRIQKTDFIFSVLGEELGFIGAVLVFLLFALLLIRGLRIAAQSQDEFGRLLATGIVMMFLVQIFVNIGVNIRLLPVTGIPLPFISFGGSSLISSLIALGLLQSIYVHRRKADW